MEALGYIYIYISSVFDSINKVYQVWTEDSNSFMNKTGNMTSDPPEYSTTSFTKVDEKKLTLRPLRTWLRGARM